jgi:hypothetical protein
MYTFYLHKSQHGCRSDEYEYERSRSDFFGFVECCKRGSSDESRARICVVIKSNRVLINLPLSWQQLVLYETSAAELDIIRDISRTFPSHVFFQQRHGPGQRSLYNVLKAYAVYDRDVGYVQVCLLPGIGSLELPCSR